MKTLTAVALNTIYPGLGYLYLKDDFRKQIAKFMVFAWTVILIGSIYSFIEAHFTGRQTMFIDDGGIPFTAVIMWGYMIYDTYKLSRNQK